MISKLKLDIGLLLHYINVKGGQMYKLYTIIPSIILRGFFDGIYAGRRRKHGWDERIHRVHDTER